MTEDATAAGGEPGSGKGRIQTVVVIGCGPAGLAAAHAAHGLGYPVRVIAPRVQTPQRGPLLLQRPIPGINRDHPDGYIRQIVLGGSILDYRSKMYGDINININGDVLAPGYHAWRFPETYDRLWELYADMIEDRKVPPWELNRLAEAPGRLVVCTAPAREMCLFTGGSMHSFEQAQVAIIPAAIYPEQPDDTIIFNADPSVPWSRSSRIFGSEVTEWPASVAVQDRPVPLWMMRHVSPASLRIIRKPISTNCDCHPRVLRTGRFGAWRNETWVDTAYYDVRTALVSDQRSDAWTRVFNGIKTAKETGSP
jgi:hypothetical protein